MCQGEFVGDRRHGQGMMCYGNGDSYDGAWVDGRKQGTGVLILARGTKYQGDSSAVFPFPTAISVPPLFCALARCLLFDTRAYRAWGCGAQATF